MKNRIFTVLFLFTLANVSFSQVHVCGVSESDQSKMGVFIDNFNKTYDHSTPRRIDPIYIPIKFHLTSKNDGTGRIKASAVLNQMTAMAESYRELGMYLYIDDGSFNYLNNTGIYENPGTFVPSIVSNKDPNAVNIFVCENANPPGDTDDNSVVLGFYNPDFDYVIIRNNDVRIASSSLAHELGHYFSLMHTFLGWELVYDILMWPFMPGAQSWDVSTYNGMYTANNPPGSNHIVEVMNQSNCTQAADKICDTPPDYNFGLGAPGCVWDNTLRDRNGDIIDPQENNMMGYFGECDEYVFTEGQLNVMLANYNSSARDHIRTGFIPDTTEIISNHELIEPLENESLEYYTKINLDWTDADGASNYLVSINTSTGDFFEYIVDESELFLEELEPSVFYFWDVQPFNDGNTKSTIKSSFFKTGTEINTSVKESELIQNVSVFPNPGRKGQDINVLVSMEKSNTVTLSLLDITGKVVLSMNQNLNQGNNSLHLDGVTEAGIYILKLDSEDGSTHKKIVIQ